MLLLWFISFSNSTCCRYLINTPFLTCHKLSFISLFFLLSSLQWLDLHCFTWLRASILKKSSILKSKFHFPFQNRSSILKWKLDFEIEIPFRNQSSILKSKLHFESEVPFRNSSSILKSKFHFEIEAPFLNRSSIFKSKLHFQIKAPF